jgi:hypothetical protein
VKRERPLPVLVLALAGLALGGLGVVGAGAVQLVCSTFGSPGSAGVVVPLTPAAADYCRDHVGGFRAYEAFLPAAGLLVSVLVAATGLALLSLRRWTRTAAAATAAVILVAMIAAALYEFAVLVPAVETWREEGARRNLARPDSPDAVPPELQWVAVLLLLGGLVFFVHAVATLMVLCAPAVAEAFVRGRPAGTGGEAPCPRDCSTATS